MVVSECERKFVWNCGKNPMWRNNGFIVVLYFNMASMLRWHPQLGNDDIRIKGQFKNILHMKCCHMCICLGFFQTHLVLDIIYLWAVMKGGGLAL